MSCQHPEGRFGLVEYDEDSVRPFVVCRDCLLTVELTDGERMAIRAYLTASDPQRAGDVARALLDERGAPRLIGRQTLEALEGGSV